MQNKKERCFLKRYKVGTYLKNYIVFSGDKEERVK